MAPTTGQTEVTLDIEVAQAIASEATMLVYIAANIITLSVLNQIAEDNKAYVVRTSGDYQKTPLFRAILVF